MCGLTAHCIERHFNYLPSPSVCHQIILEWSVDQIIKEPVSPEHDLAKLWWELFHANLLLSWTCKTVNNLVSIVWVCGEWILNFVETYHMDINHHLGRKYFYLNSDWWNKLLQHRSRAWLVKPNVGKKILKQSSQSGWHFNCISHLLLIWRSIMWSVFNLLNIHSSSG